MSDPGRLVLSGRPFWGESVIDRSRNPALLKRFRDEAAIERVLRTATDCGVGALVTTNNRFVLAALKDMGANRPEVLPLIPDVISQVREATHYGMVGAGWRRVTTIPPVRFMKLIGMGMVRTRQVLAKHFPTILELLLEVEMSDFEPFKPGTVYLHPMTTDLALATGNRVLFELYKDRMENHYRVKAGLATNNLGTLLPQLDAWGIEFGEFLAPVNDKGARMLPDRSKCEDLIRRNPDMKIVADRVAPDGVPEPEHFEYLKGLNIQTAVVDASDRDELMVALNAAVNYIG
jgi:hypothetical protein